MNDLDREAMLRYANLKLLRYKESTLTQQLNLLQRFATFVAVPLEDVDVSLFEHWLHLVSAHRTRTTARHYAVTVSRFYQFLEHESGGRIKNPVPSSRLRMHQLRRTYP